MIYLQRETAGFEKTKAQFEGAYEYLLASMKCTFKSKGKVRDSGSPIHHRLPPTEQLALARAKCRRIRALLDTQSWSSSRSLIAKIIEECIDAANYLLFIAALCTMLADEMDDLLLARETEVPF